VPPYGVSRVADVVRDLKATEQQLVGQLEGVRAAIAALDGRSVVKSTVPSVS
jgi:hypothetical protein